MDRLTLRTVLRGLSGGQEHCLVRFVDGSRSRGGSAGSGSDFFELHVGEGREAQRPGGPAWRRSPRSRVVVTG